MSSNSCQPIFYIVNNYGPIYSALPQNLDPAFVSTAQSIQGNDSNRRVSVNPISMMPTNMMTPIQQTRDNYTDQPLTEPQPFTAILNSDGSVHVQNGNTVTSSLLTALESMNTRLQGSVLRDVFERSRTNTPLDSLTGIEFILGDVSDWEHDQGVGPRLTYDEVTALPHTCYQQGMSNDTDCSICQTSFEQGNRLIVLPCNHSFHQGCVAPWLMQSNTCPLCRLEVTVGHIDDRVPSPPLSP